jgi:hypothetical protein
MDLLVKFDDESTDLECLNRAYMVMLPKKADSTTSSSFHPICLQNCPMKNISNILTSCL